MSAVDHSSHKKFYDYYAEASQSAEALIRFQRIRDTILRIRREHGMPERALNVADIGCGAGTQSMVWADLGHNIHGLDINQPLLELARQRARAQGHEIDFRLGSATNIPWANGSMDVCVVLELLEHVPDWENSLKEFARILSPGGILLITTTNKLCPLQQEFNLPFYSWYPGKLKRHFERLAVTTRRDLANYATYPAVNWFSFYSLKAALVPYGFSCMDRFDTTTLSSKNMFLTIGISLIRMLPCARLVAQMASQGTLIVGLKEQYKI